MSRRRQSFLSSRSTFLVVVVVSLLFVGIFDAHAAPSFGVYAPNAVIDQTPTNPLINPIVASSSRRYLSGIGLNDTFRIFFEDRATGFPPQIMSVSTTTGPTGFPAATTGTNITDTHFLIKDWPYFDSGTSTWYSYRAWGAVGNNANHNFYVSNDLANWTLVSTFQIPNAAGFSPRGFVYYGFHDVILLNGTYYAWGEANSGETLLVRSADGGDVWEAFDRVGGNLVTDGSLATPNAGVSPTPTGNFFDLGHDRGFGALYVPGDDSGIYLAVNTVARPSQPSGVLEANFIDPANWTWNDGSTGRLTPAQALLSTTSSHDYRETWLVPQSDPDAPWVIMYTADYSGTRALGWASVIPEPGSVPPELPETGFAPDRVFNLPIRPLDKAYTEMGDLWLEIPSLDLQTPIVGVPLGEDGWDVRWLWNQVGYLESTAAPTWPGNTALTAHVYNAVGRPGPFVKLHSLTYGDHIIIHAWGSRYVYEVRVNQRVRPDDMSVLKHETYDWITLLTCQGYDERTNSYNFRRAVRAVLVSVEEDR